VSAAQVTDDDDRDDRSSSGRRIPVKPLLWALAALVLVALALDTTYRDKGEATAADKAAFSAERYGEENFSSKIVPALEKRAVALTTLVPALRDDPDAAGEKYGHREGQSPYNYAVTGTGTVKGAPENGLLEVAVKGLKDTRVSLQVGPAINGTSLRDASGLVTFNQFVNQVDYADAATALNQQVKEKVLANVKADALDGKRVTFLGAFTFLDPSVVTVTPVRLEVAG
jgi:predicted lipoprotein